MITTASYALMGGSGATTFRRPPATNQAESSPAQKLEQLVDRVNVPLPRSQLLLRPQPRRDAEAGADLRVQFAPISALPPRLPGAPRTNQGFTGPGRLCT